MKFENYANFFVWTDLKIMDLLSSLSEEEFNQKPSENLRSIRDICNHVVVSYDVSLRPLNQLNNIWSQLDEEIGQLSRDKLMNHWKKVVKQFAINIGAMTDATIDLSEANPLMKEATTLDYILVYTDHFAYHRGQIMNSYKLIKKGKGINTDYFTYLMEHAKNKS